MGRNRAVRLNEMSEEQVREELRRIDEITRRRYQRHALSRSDDWVSATGEAVTWDDPAEALMEREESAINEATLASLERAQAVLGLDVLPEVLVDRIKEEVFEQFCRYEAGLMDWLFAAGPSPLAVMRRLFCYVKNKKPRLLWDMGFRELGLLLHETHASTAARCKALFKNLYTGWNKSAGAKANMSQAAMGNCNRLGGKKLLVNS